MMKRIFATTVVLFLACQLFAASPVPFLWEVRHGDASSTMLGTVHLSNPAVTNLPEAVRDKIRSADVVVTEIPLDPETQMKLLPLMTLPGNKTLRTVLPTKTYQDLEREIRAINPMLSVEPFQKFKPWAIMATLQLLEDQLKFMGRPALDQIVWNLAQNEKGGLETVEEQVATFEAFTQEEQILMLDETLRAMREARLGEGPDMVGMIKNAYLSGDLAEVEAAINLEADANPKLHKKFVDEFLDQRNRRMADRIDDMLSANPDKSHFFAAGVAHFYGDQSIQALLEEKGYEVERIEAGERVAP